jgi:Flp pilus assembly protein TadG
MMRRISSTHRHFRNRYQCESGQTLIEFAFVVIFWMIMIIAILEMVLFMHTYNVLADAAKEGVRYAIVHGANNPQGLAPPCTVATCPDLLGPAAPAGTVPGYNSTYGVVKTYAGLSMHDVSAMTVTVTYPDGTAATSNKTPNRVQVTVTYPYSPFFGLGWPKVNVYAAAEGRIMN